MVKRLSSVDQNNQTLINVPTPSAGTHAANKSYVDTQIAGVSTGGTTTINTEKSAQKNLTGSNLSSLTGSVNGTNKAFTTPDGVYIAGTLKVFLNGVYQPLGDAITETTPASGVFTFITAPVTNDQIVAVYQTQSVTSTTVGDVRGPSSSTDNNIPRFDGTTGKIIQSSPISVTDSGDVTITSATGTDASISPTGSDTDIDLNIKPKGANGKVRIIGGSYDTATGHMSIDNTGIKYYDFNGNVIFWVNNDDQIVETPYGRKTRTVSITSSATPSIDQKLTDQFNITALAANITSMTSGLTGATPTDGQKLMIRIKDNGTPRTITWGASFTSSGVATLLATTVANKTHMVGLVYDSAISKWVCVAVDATGY